MLDLFNDLGIKATLAIIPTSPTKSMEESDVTDILKEASKTHEIALHGLTHRCHFIKENEHKKMTDHYHEFFCLDHGDIPVAEQKQWISEGKKILEDFLNVDIKSFVPPQHLYTDNTLAALKDNGINIFSITNLPCVAPYKQDGVIFVPMNIDDVFYELGNNQTALEKLKETYSTVYPINNYFGFYFHNWSYNEKALREFFEFAKTSKYLTLSEAAKGVEKE